MSFTDTATAEGGTADLGSTDEGLGGEYVDSNPTEGFDGLTEGSATEPEGQLEQDYLFEIDGQKVTLDDARNGWLRQSDYTKKTQELAAERQRLAQAEAIFTAFERDPIATLQALQEAVGVDQGQPDPTADLDPEQARLAQLEAWVAEQEQAARHAAIDAELDALKSAYGDVDEDALFNHAIKGNFPSLDAAYKDLHFAELQARLQAAEAKKAEEDSRRQAAREAGVVHGADGVRSGAAAPAEPGQLSTFREAYLKAKRTLGQ